MAITTRAGKGSALTHTEMDNNFTELNTVLYCKGNRALGWENIGNNESHGLFGGGFVVNRGFINGGSTNLITGYYIEIPKTGIYLLNFELYMDTEANTPRRVYVKHTQDNGATSGDVCFVEPPNGNNNKSTLFSCTTIVSLDQGMKLFMRTQHGPVRIYTQNNHTDICITYLGDQ